MVVAVLPQAAWAGCQKDVAEIKNRIERKEAVPLAADAETMELAKRHVRLAEQALANQDRKTCQLEIRKAKKALKRKT